MKQDAETLRSRIADLQTIEAQMKSEDLRLTMRAAIDDCERRLATLEDDAGGRLADAGVSIGRPDFRSRAKSNCGGGSTK